MMKNLFALLLLSALISGCSRHQPPPQASACGDETTQQQCEYLRQLQQRLLEPFNRQVAPRYPGKSCLVSMHRRADGGYSVMRTEGDEALCLRAWQQVSRARDLPLPPAGMATDWQLLFGNVP